jgi:prepilin-type N-terminal cleavage/methylation domain-containing protein
MGKTKSGFTIVELLIVIVVIAILAAITAVAFNGIQSRAKVSAAQLSLKQIYTKAALTNAQTGAWPNRTAIKALIDEATPNAEIASYLYCIRNSEETFALVAWRPNQQPPGGTVHFASTEKSGLASTTYTQTQVTTSGSLCDAVLPGWTAAWWYENM